MTPAEMARLHASCFETAPRPWSQEEFQQYLNDPDCVVVIREKGFVIGRVAGPEAELLTIAVSPDARKRGIGRGLLVQFHTEMRAKGATEVFLEVADPNLAAINLYQSAGYIEVGRRPEYYRVAANKADAAIIMRLAFT